MTIPRALLLALTSFLLVSNGNSQITTPAGCTAQCQRQTVMFCQVPDSNYAITPAQVAACRACVESSPECKTGAGVAAEITSPADGSELASEVVTFIWNKGLNIDSYTLFVGKVPGGSDLGAVGPGPGLSASVKMPADEATIYVTLYSQSSKNGPRLSKSYSYHYPGPPSIDLSGATTTQSSGTQGPKPGTNVVTYVEQDPYWYINFARCLQVGTVVVHPFFADWAGDDVFIERQGCVSYTQVPVHASLPRSVVMGFQSAGQPAAASWQTAGVLRKDANGNYALALNGSGVQAIRIRRRGRTQLKFAEAKFYLANGARDPGITTGGTAKLPPNTVPTRAYNSLSGIWYVQADPNRRARIEQNGPAMNLYNEFGQASRGHFEGRDIVADDWQSARAVIEVGEARVQWSNGVFWYRTAGNSAPSIPTATTSAAPQYIGCFRDTSDFKQGGYDLDGYLRRSSSNSPQACAAECRERGFAYAGLQYGESCLCGNSYGRYGASNACTMPCTGSPREACGGPYANSVYSTGLPTRVNRPQGK